MKFRSRKGSAEYQEARRALSRHLFRHHEKAKGDGNLQERLEQHGELHVLSRRLLGRDCSHTHEAPEENETAVDQAFRMLREGKEQCDG